MKKKIFEIPITDILEVRLGGSVLTGSPVYGSTGSAGGDTEDENYGGF